MHMRNEDSTNRNEGKAPNVTDIATVAEYATKLVESHPDLANADATVVMRLAAFRRLIDWHIGRLDDDPGNVFSADQLQKLSTLALRHEDALGISRKKTSTDPESPSNRPNSIRRDA